MANTYDKGDLVRLSASFTTAAGAALDPTVVICQVKSPAGTTTSYTYGVGETIMRESMGHYHIDLSASIAGTWHYRWYSTGTGQAADEGYFTVARGEF
jgi:hypothetical protein